MERVAKISRHTLEVAALAVLMAGALLFYSGYRTARTPDRDSLDNCLIALNLLRFGVYSTEPVADGMVPRPTTKREPLYPALLSVFMAIARDEGLSTRHVTDEGVAPSFIRSIKTVNVLLYLCLVLATWWSARLFLGSRWPALAAALLIAFNSSFLSTLDEFLTEIPGALFLATSSALFYLAWTRRSFVYAALGGLSLGALIMTKIVFLLLAVLLASGAAVFLAVIVIRKRRDLLPLLARWAVLAFVALAVYAPWFARTQRVGGSLQLDNRAEDVLSVRAEYSTMSWKQYAASFVYFTPAVGPAMTARLFGEETARTFDRSRQESFFQKALRGTGRVQQEAERRGIGSRRAAVAVMARNLPTTALLTLPFAWRGAFVQVGFNIRNTSPVLLYATMLYSLFFVPAFVYTAVRMLRRRTDSRWALLVPALYSYLIHSLITHYIPRYSVPLIPIFVISVVASVIALQEWVQRKRASR